MTRAKSLDVIRDRWVGCTRCTLAPLRGDGPVLLGAGNPEADFLVLLPAPTEDDVSVGGLLSGVHGEVIVDCCEQAGMDLKRMFATSLVACRPYVILPATEDTPERIQDRDPAKTEVQSCHPRILDTIYTVDPRMILAMGDLPWKSLVIGKDREQARTIGDAAGKFYSTYIPGLTRAVRYPVLALLPPKQLIANPSNASHAPIPSTIRALRKAVRILNDISKDEQ